MFEVFLVGWVVAGAVVVVLVAAKERISFRGSQPEFATCETFTKLNMILSKDRMMIKSPTIFEQLIIGL